MRIRSASLKTEPAHMSISSIACAGNNKPRHYRRCTRRRQRAPTHFLYATAWRLHLCLDACHLCDSPTEKARTQQHLNMMARACSRLTRHFLSLVLPYAQLRRYAYSSLPLHAHCYNTHFTTTTTTYHFTTSLPYLCTTNYMLPPFLSVLSASL